MIQQGPSLHFFLSDILFHILSSFSFGLDRILINNLSYFHIDDDHDDSCLESEQPPNAALNSLLYIDTKTWHINIATVRQSLGLYRSCIEKNYRGSSFLFSVELCLKIYDLFNTIQRVAFWPFALQNCIYYKVFQHYICLKTLYSLYLSVDLSCRTLWWLIFTISITKYTQKHKNSYYKTKTSPHYRYFEFQRIHTITIKKYI